MLEQVVCKVGRGGGYRVFQKELYKRALKTKVKLGVFCYILTIQNVVYVLCINLYKLSKL
jgi:hypothetical protein